MLASLREDDLDEPSPRSPSPGLDRLPELVELAPCRRALRDRRDTGTPRRLPVAVELAAYRIVQESLTNVARHAPGAATSVRLSYTEDSLELRIRDDGPATGGARVSLPSDGEQLDRPGSGIAGMRERAIALGGRLDVRRRPTGGFEISAHLPAGASP